MPPPRKRRPQPPGHAEPTAAMTALAPAGLRWAVWRRLAKLLSADPNEDIAAAWVTKELLRELLSCTDRGRLGW